MAGEVETGRVGTRIRMMRKMSCPGMAEPDARSEWIASEIIIGK
jgi:hypothetical protein